MGAVLEARDMRLDRTVAMKVMLPGQAGPAEQDRFHLEARVLGKLAHPNIVPIHDVGVDESGQHFYTMKLVEGTTLNAILIKLAQGDEEALAKYSLNALLTIFQKVCDAVGFAHAHGIIHRDLKPENIMVGAFGEVLVMDWGLAKFLTEDADSLIQEWGEARGPTGTIVLEKKDVVGSEVSAAAATMVDEAAAALERPITVPGGLADSDIATVVGNDIPTASDDPNQSPKPEFTVPVPESPQVPTVVDQPVALDSSAMTIADDAPLSVDAMATMADDDSTTGGPAPGGLQQLPQTALSQTQLTMEGAVMGTPNFMSPEQAEGKISELDGRSDIFSLGGVLYAILTLRPPVRGKTLDEILANVKSVNIVEPSQLNSPGFVGKARASLAGEVVDPEQAQQVPHCPGGKVPSPLSAVVMKSLKRDVADRYQAVTEFAADIAAYQNGFATTAEGAGLFTLIGLFIKRHKAIAGAIAFGLVFTVIFMAKIISSEQRATAEAERATAAEGEAVKAEGEALAARGKVEHAFAKAQTALGEAAIRDLDGLRARALLGDVPEPLRDADWRYLHAKADPSMITLRDENASRPMGIEPFHALPGVFALAATDGRFMLTDAKSGQRLLAFPSNFEAPVKSPFTMSFSPDGGELAVANWDEGRVVFHSTANGAQLREWAAPRPWVIEFSPVRNDLLFTPEPVAGQAVQLRLHDAASGQIRWTFDPGVDWIQAAFHPAGEEVVVAYGQVSAAVLDAKTGKVLRELPETGRLVYRLAASPDGELAAFGDGQGGVLVVAVADGSVITQFRAGENVIRMLEFTPDSRRLVTLTYPPNHSFHHVQIWDAYSGQHLQSVLGVSRESKRGAVHPATGELVVAGETTKAWSVAQPEPGWVVDSGIHPPLIRFWPDDNSIVLNDSIGRPQMLSLLEDGSVGTNWQSTVACGRDAVLSINDEFAVIGGTTFDQSENHFYVLERQDGKTEVKKHWQPVDPFPWLELSPAGTRMWTDVGLIDPVTGFEADGLTNVVGDWGPGAWVDTNTVVLASLEGNGSILRLAKIDGGSDLASTPHDSPIFTLAVSPDGELVAEGGQDRLVRIRNLASLEKLREFRAHDGALTALAFHPHEPVIATASEDLTIRIWNHETGQLLEELRGPPSPVLSLDFSPSGRRLASAAANNLALVWLPDSLQKAE